MTGIAAVRQFRGPESSCANFAVVEALTQYEGIDLGENEVVFDVDDVTVRRSDGEIQAATFTQSE
ncbi:hypothetical protein DMJ13_10980 [halophilic archaeon]|nr:hypothetical protein DMJ13_10980 [halophilic archaeon]